MKCLLLFSGDVELYPGAMAKAEREQISGIEKKASIYACWVGKTLAKLDSTELKQK